MQVLEMEEVESLVGARKKIGNRNNTNKNKANFGAWALRNDFLPKVVVLACAILLGMLYLSAKEDDNQQKPIGDVEIKTPAPMMDLLPTDPPTNAPEPKQDDPPIDPIPTEAPKPNPTESPTEAPKTQSDETENNNDNNGEDDEATNPFGYSHYATIQPLVDHPLLSDNDATKKALAEKYGKWHFWDGDEENRPAEDYCGKFPNRDIPGEEFPDDAWQTDAVFVNHILNDADQLIARTMEAIFVEYGHGKPLDPDGMAERMKMFHWSREDLSNMNEPPEKYGKKGDQGNGGWTTRRSFDGLVRRLLHAMMTQDTFTVVMGGHSAAVGQGNHFRQSYMMQFHKVMYPVFARLGVKLITRNMAQGGLGTIQAGLGSGSIYGDEVDLLLWDSDDLADDEGMTEKDNPEHIDIFYRQALLAGNRVPVIWGGPFELLKMLHEEADVDVGVWGQATDGIIEVESAGQANNVPWAARYMKCKPEVQDLCNNEPRFCSTCWIDRDDGIKPEAKQLDRPRGQVKWHPGWRSHQLTGRNIAFALLEALQAAVNIWNEGVMGGPPLEDEFWHVTDYYENIRNKVLNLDKQLGSCYNNNGKLPDRVCTTPLKAKTQYTPRANYEETALSSIIKPAPNGYVPINEKEQLYEGPDAHNTCFDIPEDSMDVFNVVTNRRLQEDDFNEDLFTKTPKLQQMAWSTVTSATSGSSDRKLEEIVPGTGWEIWDEPQGVCDGTYNNTCNRWTGNECVLYGHHDYRGAIIGNEYSGWLVMTLKDLKEGIIILKLHTWHTEDESTRTKGWTTVDNKRSLRRQGIVDPTGVSGLDQSSERMLMRSYDTPDLPDSFELEYAIDGKITTLNKTEFLEKKQQLQRVVETLTILDDPNFTKKAKDVEIAVRLKGSGSSIVFGVSHVYWA
ncbi:hypothetical protein IV203_000883 [Nitzschia inconspicua]|uniref:Uncharacterized protein n=1 Tax=Nitzschia inconspicua TaxID=303405 RepID=A0A9K3L692_9STRA|nr:hypothetical protein IV203_000883 [Nitzschia inconspicua]